MPARMKSILWYVVGGGCLVLGLVALVVGTHALLHGQWLLAAEGTVVTGWFGLAAAQCRYKGNRAAIPASLDRWLWRLTVLYIAIRLVTMAFGV